MSSRKFSLKFSGRTHISVIPFAEARRNQTMRQNIHCCGHCTVSPSALTHIDGNACHILLCCGNPSFSTAQFLSRWQALGNYGDVAGCQQPNSGSRRQIKQPDDTLTHPRTPESFKLKITWCVQVLRSPKEAFAVAMQSWRER